MFEANVMRVMIASPSDVRPARDAVERAISAWNAKHAQQRGVVLLPWRWETSSVPGLAAPAQALLNEQGVDRSDVMVALMGSRLGAPTSNAVSGTVEEIERAVARGIPVHLYFSVAPIPADTDPVQLQGLQTFKAEIRSRGLYEEFDELGQFEGAIDRALSHDVDQLEQRKADAYFEVDSDRVYDLYETRWSFTRSPVEAAAWAGRQESRRRFTSRSQNGLEQFAITLSRESDQQFPFGPGNTPHYRLLEDSTRSDGGAIRIRPPHKAAGGAFAQNISFEPPLDIGTTAELHYEGEVPVHKYAHREQLEPATRTSRLGLRDWDYLSITIGFPVRRLLYSAFFPDDLGAEILGVRAGRGGIDTTETARLRREGHVTQQHIERNGVPGVELTLDLPRPRLKWTYRLCWRPPSENK